MISIKEHLQGQDKLVLAGLVDLTQSLLHGLAKYAVVGDQNDYERFQKELRELAAQIESGLTLDTMGRVRVVALKTLEEYNLNTSKCMHAQDLELQTMVAMLTKTLASLSAGSDTSVARLHAIELQLEKVLKLADVRNLKSRLSDCLESLREETSRQRTASAATVAWLTQDLTHAQERGSAAKSAFYSADHLSAMQGRNEAQVVITEASENGTPSYAAIFVVDRIDSVNARYGPAVGNQLLLHFSEHLALHVADSVQLFRWGASAFLCLIADDLPMSAIRARVQKVVGIPLKKTLQAGDGDVALQIACHWVVFAVLDNQPPESLFRKINSFVD